MAAIADRRGFGPSGKVCPIWTVKEVAGLMRVDIDFVYDLTSKGELIVHKYGARCVRVPGLSLRAYQRRCQSVDVEPEVGGRDP